MFGAEELLLVPAGACAAVAFSGKGAPTDCVSDCILAGAVAAGLLGLDATSGFDRSAGGDDVSCAFALARVSPLRNWRHVSELFSGSAAAVVTAGFAPNALLVSTSSWPVIGSPLRI